MLGLALAASAFFELRGGAMIRRFDPRGARVLGFNQLALGALIVIYAGWSMYTALSTPILAAAGGSTGDPQMDAMVQQVSGMVIYGLYGTLGVIGLLVPGLTALYYFTRARLVRDMLTRTPPWVIAALRAAG